MKRILKRMGAVLLTLAMLATMIPAVAAAATELKTSVKGLAATWDYIENNGGSATWTAAGTAISAETKGQGAKTNTSVLTLTNTLDTEAVLRFNYSFVSKGDAENPDSYGTLSGAIATNGRTEVSDVYEVTLFPYASVVIQLKSPREGYKANLSITDLSLVSTAALTPTITFKAPENGTYTLDGLDVTATISMEMALNTVLPLAATPDEGYIFFGWLDETDNIYLSQDAVFNLTVSGELVLCPVFIPETAALFGVGMSRYYNLGEACAAAADTTQKMVVLLNDGTLSGYHVIPEGVTLLIPYDDANTAHGAVPSCTSSTNNLVAWKKPTAYRTLTMAADATIIVEGALEVGGRHSAASGSLGQYAAPSGSLGFINMTAGSYIEVEGNLYCWGYIYGEGTVTAKDGATVYELFQVTDFRGGESSVGMVAAPLVFPLNQYYVQNVEVALTYEYGSQGVVTTSAFVGSQCLTAPLITFIGEGGMFRLNEGACVVKQYDPYEDILHLESYGDCSLAPLSLDLAGNPLDTSMFILPISNNIHITIKSGTATLMQDIMMLPGSALVIDQGATLNVSFTDTPSVAMSSLGYFGHVLVLFDKDQWNSGLNGFDATWSDNVHYVHQGKDLIPAPYSPTREKNRTAADLKDALLDVNGTLDSYGLIYSTVQMVDFLNEDFTILNGGAQVISSEGTGKVALNMGGLPFAPLYMYDQIVDTENRQYWDETTFFMIPMAGVQLTNGENTLADTQMVDTSYAEPGTVYEYCTIHDHWYTGACELPTPYEITWVVGDDSVTTEVMSGNVPTYPNDTPAKALDDIVHYVFAGWSTTADGAVVTLPAATGNATYYAVFTAVAHTYGTAATNDTHVCVCGKTTTCVDAANDGDHLCDFGCGAVKSQHVGGIATCDKQAVCTECGESYGDLLPHTPGKEADCGTAQTCTACGAELTPATGLHPYDADVTDPDCENGGYTTYTCPVCGDTYVGDYTDPNGHDYEAVVTDPDCVNGGYTTYTCTVCGDTYVDDKTPANGHDYDAVVTDPDCVNGGYTTYTCTVCGDTYVDDKTPANGHDYDAVVTDPDCVNGGYTTYTCTVCGDTYVDDKTPANGHDYDAVVTDPDCVNEGYTTYTCTVCGDTYVDDKTPANGHDYDAVVTDPDCVNEGYTTYTCTVCGDTYVDDETPANGHDYDDDMDADCNTCGYIRLIDYTVVSGGTYSVSEELRGLAFHFTVAVKGMTMDAAHVADYTNENTLITPNSWAVDVQLVGMGAVVSNDRVELTLENAQVDRHTIDVNAELLMDIDTEANTAEYAVRITNIPDHKRDQLVRARPYVVYEDQDGNEVVVYGEEVSTSIAAAASNA